jgi:signal transduction histidine kinase
MKFTYLPPKHTGRIILLQLLLLATSALYAQHVPAPIEVNTIRLSDTFQRRSLYLEDSLHSLLPEQLPTSQFHEKTQRNIFRQLSPRQVQHDWYLQFRLKNSSDSMVPVYFFPGIYLDRIDLYRQEDTAGLLTQLPRILPNLYDSIGYRKIEVPAQSDHIYYARLHFIKTNINAFEPRIIRDYFMGGFAKNFKIPSYNSNIYTYLIVGILMMMSFYALAVFILNGTPEFLYYASYALLMGLLFFLNAYLYKTPVRFQYYFQSYLDFVIQSAGAFFYFCFLRRFLVTKTNFPLLDKIFLASMGIILLSIATYSYLNFYTDNFVLQDQIENLTKYEWFLTTIIFIVYAVLRNNKMLNYLAAGHFFLLLGGLMSLLFIQFPSLLGSSVNPIWRDALFYAELGLTLELIFFLMALAFKNKQDIIERTRERERLKLDNERKEFEKQLAVVEAKQEERNRISTDMHDELGSGVTAIRLMSEIVKTKMKGQSLPEIEKISNSANDLLGKMNTIIWTMSSSNDKLDNMVAYTRAYAFEFFENTNINCHFENAEQLPATEMSGEKRRNIFLCIKESLNNVAKHSRGTDVWIKIAIISGKLQITIYNNGPGINMEKLREFGNGLKNMRKRMESIDGTFEIENNNGTVTVFTAPL